jgi:hypothetical protein
LTTRPIEVDITVIVGIEKQTNTFISFIYTNMLPEAGRAELGEAQTWPMQQLEQQQQQQPTVSTLDRLPDHMLSLIAKHLSGGSVENFRQTCQHFRQAANLRTISLDFHEVCGWGHNSSTQLPPCATSALQEHPNFSKLTIPSSWRRSDILQLLQYVSQTTVTNTPTAVSSTCADNTDADCFTFSSSSSTLGRGSQLRCLELHFQAMCPDLCASLASLAPGITRLELSLDLAFELTTKQVGYVY